MKKNMLKILGVVLIFVFGFFIKDNFIPKDITETKHRIYGDSSSLHNSNNNQGLVPEELTTIKIFKNASPSVTFINTSSLERNYWNRNITEIPKGSGSGFIWDKEGHIITNYHVVQGASKIKITLQDQSVWDAKFIGGAPEKDLAVLKIDAPKKHLFPIEAGSSSNLQVGQNVYAIGNPFGLDYTLTKGIISALEREINSLVNVPIKGAIQTDAAINPGNSGGPLLDSSGKLIGINTQIYSPSGAYAGVGFSIPVDVVKWVVPDLIKYGKINRPTLGVELASPELVSRLDIEGVLIIDVTEGSGASKAGLRPTFRLRNGKISWGDIITTINGEKITNTGDIMLNLEEHKIGDEIEIGFIRDGVVETTNLILGSAN